MTTRYTRVTPAQAAGIQRRFEQSELARAINATRTARHILVDSTRPGPARRAIVKHLTAALVQLVAAFDLIEQEAK